MIQTLGAATLGALWLPLLAWTVIVAVVLAALRVWRSGHALAQYAARLALLAALPLGLLLAAVVDFSLLAWLLPAEAPVPAAAFPPPPAVPIPPESAPAFSWGLLHTLGLLTLLAGLVALWQASRLLGHAAALARFARRLPNACSAVQPMVDRQATALGLRSAVRGVVAPDDVAPMTFGWRQPVLVLPASLLEDEEQVPSGSRIALQRVRRGRAFRPPERASLPFVSLNLMLL